MCKKCDWKQYLDDLIEMIDDGDFEFAEDTIEGISEWVEQNEHITDRQIDAVENIRDSVDKRQEGYP